MPATVIDVVATGIITFLAGSTMNSEPATNMHAAIAIEDNARPGVNKVTRFGMALPIHHNTLTVRVADTVNVVGGTKPARFVVADRRIVLEGDRVHFGVLNATTCAPLAITGAEPASSFEAVPHLSRIVPDIEMAPNTMPLNGNYGNIAKSKISSWLDMHDGEVTAEIKDANKRSDAEFRPSGYKLKVATSATWTFVTVSGTACFAVTPFGAAAPEVVVELKGRNITLDYANMAPTVGADSADALANADPLHPGITYDWELFYEILKNPPCLPPLPYVRIKPAEVADNASHHGGQGDETDPETGINCGPDQRP